MEPTLESPYDQAFEANDEEGYDPTKLPDVFEQVDIPLSDNTNALLQVGHLTTIVPIGNHQVGIRTLRIGEEFEAALLTKKYEDTVEAGRSLVTALVAAAITTVDGKPLISEAIGPGDYTLEANFHFLLNNWFWPPVKLLYDEYRILMEQLNESFQNLKKV